MSFPEQPFGFVAGRWVRSIGDTPDDADRAPDYVPVENATVVFTPQVTHRVAPDNAGWAGIIKDRVSAGVGERGQLIDAEGHDHLALATGVYSVSYDFGSGWSWPSHYIEVKPEHTVDAPLWLPPIAPPPEGPRIENRVVTIPADGEDGQVLVWDGGGFSWMDVPEGPEGPAGEVTTADLTTALAGKVTGTGMALRHDTTVGTRVFLDHPGGTTMLYGDTGWRDITSLIVSESFTLQFASRPLQIKRHNNRVTLAGVLKRDTPTAGSVQLLNHIPGFQPVQPYATYGTGRANRTPIFLDSAASASILYLTGDYPANTALAFEVSWETIQPWPTTLPGTPL